METVRGRKLLVVAMSDPLNYAAIEEIEFTTGLKVSARIATLSSIRAAILRYYHKVNPDDSPDGKMTIVHRGGDVHVMDEAPPDAPVAAVKTLSEADEEVLVGEALPPAEMTERTALADLILKREQQRRQRKEAAAKKPAGATTALSDDLDYLFGKAGDEDGIEKLESKFWALMRIMAKKGLISKDEFTKELDQSDD